MEGCQGWWADRAEARLDSLGHIHELDRNISPDDKVVVNLQYEIIMREIVQDVAESPESLARQRTVTLPHREPEQVVVIHRLLDQDIRGGGSGIPV